MSASGAKSGFGTTLSVGGAITEVVSVGGPKQTRTAIDVTHMASDNGYREFIGGLVDGGEVTCELNFIKSVATTLTGFLTAVAQSCTIVLGGSLGTFTFTALVTGYELQSEIDDKVTASLTLKVTGKPVLS
jgi:predicted secreted protein